MSRAKKEKKSVWRLWVDTERRIVSFHPVPEADGQAAAWQPLSFRSRELFQSCIDHYTEQGYRYQ